MLNTSTVSLSPVSLSYVAALRGIQANHPGEAFSYAMVNCTNPDLLIGLAASNPEGQFYGLINDAQICTQATLSATNRQVNNVLFLKANAAGILKGNAQLPQLDYLACDESAKNLSNIERTSLFELASKALKANGLLCYTYRAYESPLESLRFLVREFAPEMDGAQASDFLLEIKKLGHSFFQSNPQLQAKLDQAIAKNMPDEFFTLFDDGDARSATFETAIALRTRGMNYVGAGQVKANYVELSVPVEAQAIIVSCTENPLYQSMKDFATSSHIRSDIWSKTAVSSSLDVPELFGSFAYGITLPEAQIPISVDVFGKAVDLSTPLFQALINVIKMQPAGIGDMLQNEPCQAFPVNEIVTGLQILIALDIARPMRGVREQANVDSLAQPRFSGSFNRYIDQVAVSNQRLAMASKVMGDVINVSPQDALVMQALNRAGLANSVAALLPELQRLAHEPSDSAADLLEPTPETAYQMINDTVSSSIIQWYAYGLLEAA